MFLREFFYFNDKYETEKQLHLDDDLKLLADPKSTRLTKLRLSDICRARKSWDLQKQQQKKEAPLIQKQYKKPEAEGSGLL